MDLFSYPELLAAFVKNILDIYRRRHGKVLDLTQSVTTAPIKCKVCLTTWNDGYVDDGDWAYHVSSCVIFGRARLIDDVRITEEKVRKFALKYYPSAEEVEEEIKMGIKGVQLVEIAIEHISGKKVHER